MHPEQRHPPPPRSTPAFAPLGHRVGGSARSSPSLTTPYLHGGFGQRETTGLQRLLAHEPSSRFSTRPLPTTLGAWSLPVDIPGQCVCLVHGNVRVPPISTISYQQDAIALSSPRPPSLSLFLSTSQFVTAVVVICCLLRRYTDFHAVWRYLSLLLQSYLQVHASNTHTRTHTHTHSYPLSYNIKASPPSS